MSSLYSFLVNSITSYYRVGVTHHILVLTGALYSVISAVQVLSGTLAFILYSLVYKFVLERDGWTVGVPFWLMAFLYLIAIPFLL